MPCLLALGSLFAPRIILVLVWMFSDYLNVFESMLWPIAGFMFLPLTTLAYAWAWHTGDGAISGIGTAAIVCAVLIDMSMLMGGSRGTRSNAR